MPDFMIFLSKSLLGWLVIQSCLTLVFLWYLRSHKPKLLPDEQLPKTAVILCLRGADPFLHNCLQSLLQQNYPEYDLKLIIDSKEDPAFKIATETINQLGATNVQISTLRAIRHNCSLKCSSLVQAVSDLNNAYPVIALIDADTVAHPNWLRELVTPLIDDQVGLTTGNRWYIPTGNYWGSLVRYSGNVSSVVQMFLFQIPWGGTLAIKTEVLNRLQLLDKWGEVLTDDMLLHKLIKQEKLQIKSMYGLTEAPIPVRQTTVMDTLSVAPNKILFQNSTNKDNTIFLSAIDGAGKVIPNTTYKYKIGGSYSFFDFNVNIRNLKRDAQGNLIGEVLPSNSMAASAMRSLIPKQNLTKDGWLMIKIPNQKLTEGIQSLKSTKGQTAEIDAGQGINVTLQYIGK